MNCPHCGHENEEGTLYCSNCGMSMKTMEEIAADIEKRREDQRRKEEEERQRQLDQLCDRIRVEEQQKIEAEKRREQQKYKEELDKKEKRISEMDSRLAQARSAEEKARKTYGRICIFLIGMFAVILFMVFRSYNSLNGDYRSYRNKTSAMVDENERLTQENKELEKKLDKIETFVDSDILVRIKDIYNDEGGENGATKSLDEIVYADEMRYLAVDYEIYVLNKEISEPVDIYIDYYLPDGTLDTYSKSAENHTSPLKEAESGYIYGWNLGNSEKSLYDPGTYRIEIIYNGKVAASRYCEIY